MYIYLGGLVDTLGHSPSKSRQSMGKRLLLPTMWRGRMQGGQWVKVPERQNAPHTQDETRPQGVILEWSP